MKRKYKLLLIIIVSSVLTYFIYFAHQEEKISILSLGDGVSSGETAYNIDGISYNDYLKEYFSSKKLLKSYNNNFAKKNYQLKELISDIENNEKGENEQEFIDQLIYKADIITICIGEDELTKLIQTNDLDKDIIKEYLNNYAKLLSIISDMSESKIVVLGLYENGYLDKSKVIIINSELANISLKYNAIFINISDLLLNEDYFLNKNSYYFNYKAHNEIAEIIIHSV